jgi:hypothetical protein
MRRFGNLPLLAPLALLGAVAGYVAAFCGAEAKTNDGATVKMPGQAARVVVSGDHLYTVADGRLFAVDLKKHAPSEMSECYAKYPTLKPFLDAADGKACIASDDAIHVIDLNGGMMLHSAKYKGEVHGLGFAGDNRVFILGRTDVTVLDVSNGETVRTIPILKEERVGAGQPAALSAYQKVGNLLYVADSVAMRLKVVDLEAGKVVDEMGGGCEWYTGVQVVGDRAFVRLINLSYGINNPLFGVFDLKTKKYSDLKHPNATISDGINEKAFGDVTLVAGPDGGVCLGWKGKVYQYDADGRKVGETPLAKDDDGRLVGVWNGQALTAGKDALRLTPLAKATAAKSD